RRRYLRHEPSVPRSGAAARQQRLSLRNHTGKRDTHSIFNPRMNNPLVNPKFHVIFEQAYLKGGDMKHLRLLAFAGAALCAAGPAQSDYYLGQSILVGFNFCPQGFVDANGQLLPISQNQALFGLYSTTYGGDGKNTFALPDLRGRIPINQGDAAGLPPAKQGDSFGTDATTLTVAQMPPHTHDLQASVSDSTTGDPAGNLLTNGNIKIYDNTTPPSVPMAKETVGLVGGFKPFDQHQPTLVIHYCIALQGLMPP